VPPENSGGGSRISPVSLSANGGGAGRLLKKNRTTCVIRSNFNHQPHPNMKHSLLTLLTTTIFAITLITVQAATPKVGDKAPAVEAKDQDGKTIKLADALKSGPVLIYFYPKDNTPGCTKEACGLRDRMGDLKKQNVTVLGVSRDDAASHKKFIADHNLNFSLLVDKDGQITEAFGAAMTGKPMSRRVSFLIGKDGVIKHVTDVPSADVHLAEMKDAVAKLK
jgi:peroxiredoxin Q/BCP